MHLIQMERWITNSRQLMQAWSQPDLWNNSQSLQDRLVLKIGVGLIPRGWIRQNQAVAATRFQTLIETARKMAGRSPTEGILSDLGKHAEAMVEPTQRKPLYHFLANRLISTVGSELQKVIRGSQTVRSGAVGCALERYRLKHGAYPESLASLIPEFIPEMPRDLIDGQPLRYRQTEDGLFKLWSIGEDGIDNGGRPRPAKGPQTAENQGIDWVWPY